MPPEVLESRSRTAGGIRLSYYEVLLFLHITATAVWFGGGFILLLLAARMSRMSDIMRAAEAITKTFLPVKMNFSSRKFVWLANMLLQRDDGVTAMPLVVTDDEDRMLHLGHQMRVTARFRSGHPFAHQAGHTGILGRVRT